MLNKISKFLILTLLVLLLLSSSFISLAHEEDSTNNISSSENDETTSTDETISTEEEIHYGDLYLFDNNIVMDKIVYGNVFIFGSNVEITGQISGNLFVFGNNVNFNQSGIRYSAFVCADSVYFNGGCGSYSDYGNLYVAANKLEMTYDSYVTGDVKAVASDITLKAGIGRDVDLICNNLDLGSGEDIPLISGNLTYTANKEITIPEGIFSENSSVTYTNPSELNNTFSSITDVLISFSTCIFTVLIIYILLNKFTPNFVEKLSNKKLCIAELLKSFGLGLLSIIIVCIVFVILLATTIGVNLALILALLFVTLCLISIPCLVITIANVLKPILKIEKTYMFYILLALVSTIIYGITFIPYIGGLLSFIINVTSIGWLINIYLPKKELTDEQKAEIEEVKKLKKENKEKVKQAKLEEKAIKKQEKLDSKKDKE